MKQQALIDAEKALEVIKTTKAINILKATSKTIHHATNSVTKT